MRTTPLRAVCVTLALFAAEAATAFAQDTTISPTPAETSADADPLAALGAVTCPDGAVPATLRDDQRVLDNAWRAFQTASYAGVRVYLPRLQEVVAHAPACYPEIERRGDTIIVRGESQDNAAALMLLLVSAGSQQQRNVRVVNETNVYMRAALMLGSYAIEMHQFEEALTWLDRGLALQPHAQFLVSEKSMALSQIGRNQEAHDLLRAEINSEAANVFLDRARFERMDGVVLIDLGRLDDAEGALNESIRLQPDNPTARSELQYIAQLRAGRAPTPTQMTTPNAPRPETQ